MECGTRAVAAAALLVILVTNSAIGSHIFKSTKGVLDEDQLMASMKTYTFEDFFWTGSGDGPFPPDPHGFYGPSISTKTIVATVYIDSPNPEEEDCLNECPISPPSPGDISPTKTSTGAQPLPDPSYWLLTVLRAPAPPLPPNLEKSLARLYQKAFIRQQERHLGIAPTPSVPFRKKHHAKSREENRNSSIILLRDTSENPEITSTQETYYTDETESMREKEEEGFVEYPFEYINTLLNTTLKLETRPERSVGIQFDNSSDLVKRNIYPMEPPPSVEVFLYNVSKVNSNDTLKVIYWVSVGGRPVPAQTAARDMLLLADSEVAAELGYPVTTKAEPYLKAPDGPIIPGITKLTNSRDLWLIIGAGILAAFIILLSVSLLTCRIVTRRKSASASDRILSNTKESTLDKPYYPGKDNRGFVHEKDLPIKPNVSPMKKYDNKRSQPIDNKYDNGSDSCESSSTLSDLSQMTATLRQKQKLFEQQMQNEYSIINKKNKYKNKKLRSRKIGATKENKSQEVIEIPRDGTLQQFSISDGSPSSSSCDSIMIRKPSGIISPTSYLSMPSVKSFPRGNAVEPLSRVLEPLSVRHLDIDTDSPVHTSKPKKVVENPDIAPLHKKNIITLNTSQNDDPTFRYGSIDKDPGVVSPMIWNLHCKRMQDGTGSDATESSQMANISRMRKRFNELVDDAFSLFGSGSNSLKSNTELPKNPNEPLKTHKLLNVLGGRRQSIKEGEFYESEDLESQLNRPHTALPTRPPLPAGLTSPSSAWESTSTVEMRKHRPQSTKTTTSNVIDPSLPLLKAIKKELDKLPGTSDA